MRPATRPRFAISVLFAAVLGGCALQTPPDTQQLARSELTHAQPPVAWKAGSASTVPAAVRDGWLADFGDPQLVALADEALRYNLDLRAAAARVQTAKVAVKLADGALFPTVGLTARTSGQAVGADGQLSGFVLSAIWELDLWGRIRYGQSAAQDVYASAQADAHFARESIVATLATAWFVAAQAVRQQQLAAQMSAAAQQLVTLARQRERVGVGSQVDVAQAQANLQSNRDVERQIDAALLQSRRALEVLLGRYPAAEIALPSTLSHLPAPVAGGVPSELLDRRPDVTAAALRVSAAFARVGEARAARLPSISLTAALSSINSSVFDLKNVDNPSLGLGASLLYPVFAGGRLAAQVEYRTAEQQEAGAAFARTALRAFNEVEAALASEASLARREPLLRQSLADSEHALELERQRYKVGSRDLRSVTQLQMAALAAQLPLLKVQTEQRVQRVQLHLALGSSFAPADAMVPVAIR